MFIIILLSICPMLSIIPDNISGALPDTRTSDEYLNIQVKI